ncbi:MAG TPA: hypothetical protein VF021_09530 [Longimicrobiales bacterium]
MDTSDDQERRFDAWRSGSHERPTWRQQKHDSEEIRGLPEWWELEPERFDGFGMLSDVCGSRKKRLHAAAFGRLLVLQVALRCLRRVTRGEDIVDHVAATRAYLDALHLHGAERKRLSRVLRALQPFDPAAATDALMAVAWTAQRAGQHGSAQSLLAGAYESARRFGLHAAAAAAAAAFAGMARMHECPRTARKWQGRAYIHARRAARGYAM